MQLCHTISEPTPQLSPKIKIMSRWKFHYRNKAFQQETLQKNRLIKPSIIKTVIALQ